MTQFKSNLVVAKRDVRPTAPSHVAGVAQGNNPGTRQGESGIVFEDGRATGTARRSTSICPEEREPIDPQSPHLTPA